MAVDTNTSSRVAQILSLNQKNNERLFQEYNPLTGSGSLVPRKVLRIDDQHLVYIPTYLIATAFFQEVARLGSVADFARAHAIPFEECMHFVNKQRIKYDFEFWAATCAKIKDKRSGNIVPFIPRFPQRTLIKDLVEDLFSNKPVRVILLKARQWGGSTAVQLFAAWIQILHRINWNSCIVAHMKDQSRNVRAMYSRMAQFHPKAICEVSFCNFEGSQTNRQLKGRGAVVSLASVQNPEALRSDDLKLAHCTEVGLWGDTSKRKPEDVMQSIVGSVPDEPFTVIVIESTAKGVGNYFHSTWVRAEKGENAYKPVFVPWFDIDIYYRPFANEQEKIEFATTLTDQETYYLNIGATLEGLKWYRFKQSEMQSDWRMKSEFPSTPLEAFVNTGRNIHSPTDIQRMMAQTSEPIYRGEMIADAAYGKDAIGSSLAFSPSDTGNLWLWAMPDKTKHITNRYVVSMDIGGKSDGADWTVISVIDRYMMLLGGDEECIGTYRFHMDQDLAIWKGIQLARFYNDALFVPEFNSVKRKQDESDHFYTILDEVVGIYDNIYSRDDPTKVREGVPPRYGFHTNKSTKNDLITQMTRRFRDQLYMECDRRALEEAMVYEQKNDGTFGAVEGAHDDIYMSRAIGLKVSSVIDLPHEVVRKEKPRSTKSEVRSHANI